MSSINTIKTKGNKTEVTFVKGGKRVSVLFKTPGEAFTWLAKKLFQESWERNYIMLKNNA